MKMLKRSSSAWYVNIIRFGKQLVSNKYLRWDLQSTEDWMLFLKDPEIPQKAEWNCFTE